MSVLGCVRREVDGLHSPVTSRLLSVVPGAAPGVMPRYHHPDTCWHLLCFVSYGLAVEGWLRRPQLDIICRRQPQLTKLLTLACVLTLSLRSWPSFSAWGLAPSMSAFYMLVWRRSLDRPCGRSPYMVCHPPEMEVLFWSDSVQLIPVRPGEV